VLSGHFVTDGQALFSAEEIAAGWVLACQTLPKSDVEIDRLTSGPDNAGAPLQSTGSDFRSHLPPPHGGAPLSKGELP
jgi:hypothetical protein